MKLAQIGLRLAIEVGMFQPQQFIEEVDIGEDDAEQLPIVILVAVDGSAIESNFTFFRLIQADEQLGERGLAAAVASDQEDQLTRPEHQVDGAEREARAV